jgi:hypothetical protein
MQHRASGLIGALFAACASSAALAHHSNAMFDRTKEVVVAGTVHEFQWTNPHIFIELMVADPNGPYTFSIEGPSPGVLKQHGWKFNSLKVGDKVVVKVHPLKGDRKGGGLISVSKDGMMLGDAVPSAGYESGK